MILLQPIVLLYAISPFICNHLLFSSLSRHLCVTSNLWTTFYLRYI